MQLNEEQRNAVEIDRPFLLCVAGAGSGKTRVLTSRVIRLLRNGANPARMLVCTFTRAAAREMRERIEAEYGGRYLPTISTLHSWAGRLLRRYPEAINRTRVFSVYDQRDREDLIRVCAEDINAHDKPQTCRIKTLERKSEVMEEYRRRLAQADALDFDQLERLAWRLLIENNEVAEELQGYYDHILVDEAQDLNDNQAEILMALGPANLFAVFDTRQAIYSFRGSRPEIVERWAASPTSMVVGLARNYRSVPPVVLQANRVMIEDTPMIPMREATRDENCACDSINDNGPLDEPAGVAYDIDVETRTEGTSYGDIAVLARSWRVLEAVHDALVAAEVPVNFCGFTEDPWTTHDGRMLARAIQFLRNPRDLNYARFLDGWGVDSPRCGDFRAVRAAVFRSRAPVLSVMADMAPAWTAFKALRGSITRQSPVRDVAQLVLETIGRGGCDHTDEAIAAIPEEVITLEDFADWWIDRSLQDRVVADEERDAVTLTTIHGAKGLEWPVVYLAHAVDAVFPGREPVEEMRRLLYVGVTRARDRLVLSYPSRFVEPWGRTVKARPSPLLGNDCDEATDRDCDAAILSADGVCAAIDNDCDGQGAM